MLNATPYSSPSTQPKDIANYKGNRSRLLTASAILFATGVSIVMLLLQRNLISMVEEFGVSIARMTSIASSPLLPMTLISLTLIAAILSTNRSTHRFANIWNALLVFSTILASAIFVWGAGGLIIQLATSLQ